MTFKYTRVHVRLIRMDATCPRPTIGPRLPPPGEPRLPVSAVRHLFPLGRFGKPPEIATVGDYVRRGVRGLYLEGGAATNGSWWTTEAAVERFLTALTARAMGMDVAAPATDGERRARAAVGDIERIRGEVRRRRREGAEAGTGDSQE